MLYVGISVYLLIALGVAMKRSSLGRYKCLGIFHYPELFVKGLLWLPIALWHWCWIIGFEILSRD